MNKDLSKGKAELDKEATCAFFAQVVDLTVRNFRTVCKEGNKNWKRGSVNE